MNEKIKRLGTLSLAKELSKNEQKKILGGCYETGYICDGSQMSCTTSQINVAYCQAAWHSNYVDTCYIYYGC